MQNHIRQLLQQHGFVVEESGCWIGLPAVQVFHLLNVWCIIKQKIRQRWATNSSAAGNLYRARIGPNSNTKTLETRNLNAQMSSNCFEKKRRCYTVVNMAPSQLFWDLWEASNFKRAHFVHNILKCLSLNICYINYALLWIKYWLMWFESCLVFFLFSFFFFTPDISGIRVASYIINIFKIVIVLIYLCIDYFGHTLIRGQILIINYDFCLNKLIISSLLIVSKAVIRLSQCASNMNTNKRLVNNENWFLH